MTSRQEQFSGTKAVTEAHRFDVARLQSFLEASVRGFRGPLEVRQFKGGQSNPTYRLSAASGQYVMRRKPPGKLLPSAHAVDREYRVIRALYEGGFPVPEPIVFCADESIVGTMFYVMECVEGRVFWELDLPALSRDERAALYDSVNETLARLHNFDYEAAGLSDFGKPGNYFARQIARWSKQYYASETQSIADMDKLIEWLPANVPSDDSTSIVHGDFRLDNIVVDSQRPVVRAVLDWELSTIGHPLGDLTYHLMAWQMPEIGPGSSGLLGMDLAALGIPDEDAYVARYCERTGRANGIENRDFYSAFNFFRIAAISQGIAGRVRDGTAASAHAEQAGRAVVPLAQRGWAFAKRAGAQD